MNQETHRKLNEAQSCYHLLRKQEGFTQSNIIEKPEEFRNSLSAFLSAARSVTFVLQAEQRQAYQAWFPDWEQGLSPNEKQLLSSSTTSA